MGAWGSGYFENDDASDFVGDLTDARDWHVAEAAFQRVISAGDEYLEAPESSIAIAAAAVVAHRLGRLSLDLEPDYLAAIASLNAPDAELVSKARAALARIKQQSELGDLWEEGGAKAAWLATVETIEDAL